MFYLAQLQRKPIRKLELRLLAVQINRELWIKLAGIRTVTIKSGLTPLADDSLVLVKFNEARQVTQIIDGVSEIPLILHKLSLQLLKLLAKEP